MGLGDMFTSGGPPGMTPEMQKWLRKQQLRALFGRMASASAPSRDPRSGSLGYILGQGAQGMGEATGPAMQQIMASDKFNAMRDARKQKDINRQALAGVPRNKPIRAIGPPTPQGAYPQAEGNMPRDMGAYLRDYAMTAMKQGDLQTASAATGMIPKTAGKPDAWQKWGHGQMRNKQTGEIKDVPTKPGEKRETWTFESKYNSALKDRFGTLTDDGWVIDPDQMKVFKKAQTYAKDYKKIGMDPLEASVRGEQRARQGLVGEKATTAMKTGISKGPSTPAPEAPEGGMEVDIAGNAVTYQGKSYNLAPDGTVMIDGRKYRVKQ